MQSTTDVSRRLWALCNVLRDDGITYHEYISELTLVLFFRLANLLGVEADIPKRYRWQALREMPEQYLLDTYNEALANLVRSDNENIRVIFSGSYSRIRTAASLSRLINGIDSINWRNIEPSSVGDIYENLIARNAQESRYGAGQYFTPRALVEAMVRVTKPGKNEFVYDPAAGTAGFLVAAGAYSRNTNGAQCELAGAELVPEVYRLAQMNLHLHDLDSQMKLINTLSQDPSLVGCDVCLTNPPFGTKGDVGSPQFVALQIPTNNKQLGFLQHVYSGLQSMGRAAVVVPDNVLFESGAAAGVRTQLLDNFDLHTILRLPAGIFYATGVKTSVLFFARTQSTESVWIYDLRWAGGFTKKRPLELKHLQEFMQCYGSDSYGRSKRTENQHFRAYSRQSIKAIGDRLDIGPSSDHEVPEGSPAATLGYIAAELENASAAVRDLQEILARADSID